ncbi:tripartite tricarboxylate transporter substrate binding protein [Hydrogenophaga sp. BPS33]|uniref:tripartite tricarboxylate transporter substrate binding protein n=1 Tax=Hydrogenophaga sp. BPS33 TaxID=2651974 RepID=UPI001F1E5350|nr:tripartite tricarboxylate transporter substrate binding protein [Hydrogenophaga sp. BPS33]
MLCTMAAAAQSYPNRPLRLVVPFPAGGIVDVTARQLGQKMGETLGQSVVIDNRPGAGGSVGTQFVAKSPADGYTLLMAFDTHAVNPLIYKNLPFDTFKDFAPVSSVGTIPLIFASTPGFPAKNLAELVQQSKANPAGLSYGSVGAGSSGHLLAEQFKVLTGANMLHIPFKGGAPALNALMGEQIQLVVFAAGTAVPHVHAGRLTALAVTGSRRAKVLPDVPTTTEAGFAQLNSGAWMGILAPAGTPEPIVGQLRAAIAKAVKDSAMVKSLGEQAVELNASGSAEFGQFIRAEHDKWAKVIKDAHLDLSQ